MLGNRDPSFDDPAAGLTVMDLRSLCSIPCTLLPFRPREGQAALAIVCKITYRLAPTTSTMAAEQEPLQQGEKYYQDDPTQSVERPNDLVPFKQRAEVLVVGSAYSPQRRPVRLMQVRLIIGEIDKAVDVHCQRTLNRDGSVREGMSWINMPLRYERAAGGADTWNAVGMSGSLDPRFGNQNLPQFAPAGFFADGSQPIPPVGFGPLSAQWSVRRDRLGPRAGIFSEQHLHQHVLGSDFDPLYFQTAPRDQQLESLRPDERIVLENLHPEHPRLVTSLPGHMPRAFVNAPGNAGTAIPLRADTLWIDTDRGLCTLVFRGQINVASFDQPGTVFVVLQAPGEAISWTDVQAKLDTEPRATGEKNTEAYDPDTTTELDAAAFRAIRPVTPFRAGAAKAAPASPRAPSDDEDSSTAVYNVDALLGRTTKATPFAPAHGGGEATQAIKTATLVGPKPVMPFGPPPGPPMAPPPAPGFSGSNPTLARTGLAGGFGTPPMTLGAPPAPPAAAPIVPAATPYAEPAKPLPVSMLQHAAAPAAVGGLAGASELARQAPAPAFGDSPAPPRIVDSPRPAALGEAQTKSMSAATYEGVLAASNAAADPQTNRQGDKPNPDKLAPDKPAKVSGESIELIWYENSYLGRMRKHKDWAPLFRPPPKAPAPQRGQPPPPPPSPEQIEDAQKADVFAVLSRAEPVRVQNVAPGQTGNDDHDALLHLLTGALSFPLDEIETLKLTSRTAAPLASSDKKLKEVLDTVEEVLKMPLEGAPEVVQSFTVRVRDAWTHANRLLPPDYLVSHTERTLLNQRHYQKRELLDDEWIRSLFSTTEGQGIPTYIPAKLAKRLPLFRQFNVRMVVEVLSQQDMYESHPLALRVVALARILGTQEASPAKPKR